MKLLKNQRGQGLSEYIIIVSLISIASIGVMRVLGKSVQSQLANITFAVQGKKKEIKTENIQLDADLYSKKDLSNFMQGAASDNKE